MFSNPNQSVVSPPAGALSDAVEEQPVLQLRPRLTLIGDREIENLAHFLAAAQDPSYALTIAGFVAPGFEADWLFMESLSQLFPDDGGQIISLREASEPMSADEAVRGTEPLDLCYVNPTTRQEFQFLHEPYNATELKARGDAYRAEYCQRLLKTVEQTAPDYILLSNFKLVLDRAVAEAFAGRIINIHPSVLPQLKGWRSENRAANLGEWPEASGYTIHNVSADLDGGATYFQQRVRVPEPDPQLLTLLGEKKYAEYREEVLRWAIIRAQAECAPAVLALVASDAKRITVRDAEAFAAEGRPGFESTPAFRASMEEDFAHWKRQHAAVEISFDEWQAQHRRPYERVLFLSGEEWITAEKVLGLPSEVIVPSRLAPRTSYSFELPYDSVNSGIKLAEIVAMATGGDGSLEHRLQFSSSRQGTICHAEVSAPLDLVLEQQGIAYEAHTFSVSVRTQRLNQAAIDL